MMVCVGVRACGVAWRGCDLPVDDELFLQSGGPEFIRDALNLLVGALKFQATPPSTTRDPFCAFPPASTSNAAAAAAAGTPPVVPAGAPPASAASAATTTTTAPPPSGGSGVATTTATVSGAGVASTPATPLLASPSASASASTSARQPGAGNGAGSGSGSDSGAQTAHHHHGGSGVAHGRSTASAVPALPSITRRYRCSATMSDACARDLLSELPTAAALDASPCGSLLACCLCSRHAIVLFAACILSCCVVCAAWPVSGVWGCASWLALSVLTSATHSPQVKLRQPMKADAIVTGIWIHPHLAGGGVPFCSVVEPCAARPLPRHA